MGESALKVEWCFQVTARADSQVLYTSSFSTADKRQAGINKLGMKVYSALLRDMSEGFSTEWPNPIISVHLPSSTPRTKIQQKKTEEKNNLLSVGVLKGFVIHKCICNACMCFYGISINHMARCSKMIYPLSILLLIFFINLQLMQII